MILRRRIFLQNRASYKITAATLFLSLVLVIIPALAQQASFRNAPPSAAGDKNPYSGSASAIAAGKQSYAKNCAQCHGANRQGMGPAPALDTPSVRNAKPGEVFWFITTGKLSSGMPSWSQLSNRERWQIVTFLDSPPSVKTVAK
jgi:mono/diheme cytochrome c family protein